MTERAAHQAIAERYLDEMLDAERTRDFEAWCRRWYKQEVKGLSNEIYQSDLDQMESVLGPFQSRECLGFIQSRIDPEDDKHPSLRLRFVFRMVFEKCEALNFVSIQQIGGDWYACENRCSF